MWAHLFLAMMVCARACVRACVRVCVICLVTWSPLSTLKDKLIYNVPKGNISGLVLKHEYAITQQPLRVNVRVNACVCVCGDILSLQLYK